MYPSLYYAIKDLLGLDLPFLKMIQMFGFFVALAFIAAAYLLTKEMKRKEAEGRLTAGKEKHLKGEKASLNDLITSGIIGFLIGYKVVYILFNFSSFTEDTQGFLLSTKGSFVGGLIFCIASAYLKYREKEKTKLPSPVLTEELVHPYQLVGNMTLIAAFTGLLGAKIFHNLENWDDFTADPVGSLLSFDGLTMYGGLIVASIAVIYYGKKKNISSLHLIDAAAPGLMLAYGIGRIGCHLSGDGDWGIDNLNPKPAFLSWLPDWAWSFDYPHNVVNAGVAIENCNADKYCNHLVPPVFPTAFYETVACLILFFILWNLRKRITTPGVLFCIYLMFNGTERFFIEKIRVNTLYHISGFGFTQAELISTVLFFLGLAGIFYFRGKEKNKQAVE